ncbi:hypothetical protein [Bradyrhizobium sp. WSM471]|nr:MULTISPECIES: hypothetical protein [Bradyrhizobium]UFW43365.1 hypothetical protein BcanWSM471_09890 [Bradyrhizobium canariense]
MTYLIATYPIAFLWSAFVAGVFVGYAIRALISMQRRRIARTRRYDLSED